MNKEEKKAIEYYQNKEVSFSVDFDTENLLKALGITEKDSFENHQIRFKTLLNLIEKLQKENEEYSKQLDLDYVDKNYISKQKIKDEIEELQLVAAYFVCDYFTLKDQSKKAIGGIDYIYPTIRDSFSTYAKNSFYTNKNKDLAVDHYNIVSYSPSKVTIEGLEDQDYYNVLIEITFNEDVEDFNNIINVTIVKKNKRFYVCGIDHA